MIDFFGVGFNYRQISKEEFMKISSFCEDILVKKYYFIKETMREGANNEYDIVSYYKTFKEYKNGKTTEMMRIQLIPESTGRSINVVCNGSKNVVKYFIIFHNFIFSIFKDTKVSVNTERGNNIKIVRTPSYITEFEVELEYNNSCNGYVEAIRTNAKMEQKNSPDPIVKRISIFNPITKPSKTDKVKKPKKEKKEKVDKKAQGKEILSVQKEPVGVVVATSNQTLPQENSAPKMRGGVRYTPDGEEGEQISDINTVVGKSGKK